MDEQSAERLVELEKNAHSDGSPFEGYGYVRVSQVRARESALCTSSLSTDARLLLLIHAETQRNGCCPMGPEAWVQGLGMDPEMAASMIGTLQEVGVLTVDSDVYCLHVHGRAINRGGARGRKWCGHQARPGGTKIGRPKSARPRQKRYHLLKMTGRPFQAPGVRAPELHG